MYRYDTEAVHWYRLAAEQGHAEAQFSLGLMYATGSGVIEDTEEAVRWYRLAAEQNGPNTRTIGGALAQFGLGVTYANGRGVPQDVSEALRWYRLVAESDMLWLLDGLLPGPLRDGAEAVRWNRLAAEQGHTYSQFRLGQMYASGSEGVLKDATEAVRWYRLAAEQGHSEAQHKLGFMYASGAGVLKDTVLGHMWLNIAGANGDEDARELRDTLERDMTLADISRATELARACMDSDYGDCAA